MFSGCLSIFLVNKKGKIFKVFENMSVSLCYWVNLAVLTSQVKFTVQFRGREMQHTGLGYELMKRITDDTAKLGKIEVKPKFEGRQIIMIIQPL